MNERTTQLRAKFDLGAGRMRVVWVVTEAAVLAELIEDATPELAALLADHYLRVDFVRWFCLYGETGVWLRADLRVRPYASSTSS